MKVFVLSIALFSGYSVAASTGFNDEIAQCAGLLPKAKMYNISMEYNIDTTQAEANVDASFGIDWSPEYYPSDAEQEAAFKALEPFVLCMGEALTGQE